MGETETLPQIPVLLSRGVLQVPAMGALGRGPAKIPAQDRYFESPGLRGRAARRFLPRALPLVAKTRLRAAYATLRGLPHVEAALRDALETIRAADPTRVS